jgi:hypothetical protein
VTTIKAGLAGPAHPGRYDEIADGPPRPRRTGGDESTMDSSRGEAGNASPGPGFGRLIRRARMACRLSQIQLAQRMRDIAAEHGGTATLACLKVMISKWENEVKAPNEYNRRLLAAALGVTVADLGLPEDPDYLW